MKKEKWVAIITVPNTLKRISFMNIAVKDITFYDTTISSELAKLALILHNDLSNIKETKFTDWLQRHVTNFRLRLEIDEESAELAT
jgi:hypothetical protein